MVTVINFIECVNLKFDIKQKLKILISYNKVPKMLIPTNCCFFSLFQ